MNADHALTLIAVAAIGAVFCALQLRRALRADRHTWSARHDRQQIPAAPDNKAGTDEGLLTLCRLSLAATNTREEKP